MSELTDKLIAIRSGYEEASSGSGAFDAGRTVMSVIHDVETLESMLELAWDVICEADYEGYDSNLRVFMEEN